MRPLLMHRDRDFVIAPELHDDTFDAMLSGNPFALNSASGGEGVTVDSGFPHAPAMHELLTEDLGLDVLFSAMGDGDVFLRETARLALLSGMSDPGDIAYRQAVARDAHEHPEVVRRLYALSVEAIEHERNPGTIFRPTKDPESMLTWCIKVLELELGVLEELRSIAEAQSHNFRSEGFQRFFSMLSADLDHDYLQLLREEMEELRFDEGISASVRLGSATQGSDWIIHRVPKADWRQRFGFAAKIPTYSFDVSPGDAAGQRALASLRSRALADIAEITGQAVAHMKSFFTMLRLELAFHVGCVNLRERLAARGQPTCWPDAASSDSRELSALDLRDITLALTLNTPVVGNDLDADGVALVVMTGANQGGKTTLLRGLGTAQVMMRAGMFVCATYFRASVSSVVLTHWTRGEDTSMRAGKLDEELKRMSQVADHVTPHALLLCNESFASTNEREGSEIGRHVLRAMLDCDVTVVLVTHMFELAQHLCSDGSHRSLSLRPQLDDGHPSFRLIAAPPLSSISVSKAYEQVFGHTS